MFATALCVLRGGSATVTVLLVVVLASGCNSAFGIREGTPRCTDPMLIDDMEDGISDICPTDGRHGWWYVVGDGTSTDLGPIPFHPSRIDDGEGGSRYAAHFSGSGFGAWGALMGFHLIDDPDTSRPYDASRYSGIKFRLKSNVPVTVSIAIPKQGDCADPQADACGFNFVITAPSPTWADYEIPFAALPKHDGSTQFTPNLLAIAFGVAPGGAFDVWVDDIRFYRCSSCIPTCNDPLAPVGCPANYRVPAACYAPGTNCTDVLNRCRDPNMIDDLEDDEPTICDTDGRKGYWYIAAGPPTATVEPPLGAFLASSVDDRPPSHYAARMKGSGADWAVMGFDLALGANGYDAHIHGGLSFFMKSDVPVQVNVQTPETVRATDRPEGTCMDTSTTRNCDNAFAYTISPQDTSQWHEYHVPFSALTQSFSQDGYFNIVGGTATFDVRHLLQINFSATIQQRSPFDVWIDDVRFDDCINCKLECPEGTMSCAAVYDLPAACWPQGTDCSSPPHAFLTRVWGSGPTDMWTTGFDLVNASGVFRHWNGSFWDRVIADPSPYLLGVSGIGPTDAWAAGNFGKLARYNGSKWSLDQTPAQGPLMDVWGSGADDIWVIEFPRAIWHYDGSAWSLSTSNPTQQLFDLWGTGAHDVWAGGSQGTLMHFDGAVWATVQSNTDRHLVAGWSNSANDVWVVGFAYRDGNTIDSTILHGTGDGFSFESWPDTYLTGIWGSGPDDVWAVGSYHGGAALVLHWNGSTWQTQKEYFGPGTLYGVWGSGPNDIYAVGLFDVVEHYDGTGWNPLHSY